MTPEVVCGLTMRIKATGKLFECGSCEPVRMKIRLFLIRSYLLNPHSKYLNFKSQAALTCALALLLTACAAKNQINPSLSKQMPQKILWAWERPEDLRFLDQKRFGVAFLAETLTLERNDVIFDPRRQPLEVNPGTYLIAVTRIETNKAGGNRPAYSVEQQRKLLTLIRRTLDLPDVKAVQIDFDAVASEREFYREMMIELRKRIPAGVPLTMTSLASWCTGDAWFNDFPVDEAVPMAFQMGSDTEKIKRFLANGNDWNEPLCRGSYGISVEEPLNVELKPGRRIYYFKSTAWSREDIQ